MKLKSIAKNVAAVGIAMVVGSPAFATEYLKLDNFALGSPSFSFNITYDNIVGAGGAANLTGVNAGRFAGTFGTNSNGNLNPSFQTYCTELSETFSWHTTFAVTRQNFANDDYLTGAQKANLLGKLFYAAAHDASFAPNTQVKSAAFQLAVWEIVYGEGNNVTAGSGFRVTNASSGDRLATVVQANNWLGSLSTVTGSYTVQQLHNDRYQDQLVVTVPEPETYAMMLAGLGLMGAIARRRTRAAV